MDDAVLRRCNNPTAKRLVELNPTKLKASWLQGMALINSTVSGRASGLMPLRARLQAMGVIDEKGDEIHP